MDDNGGGQHLVIESTLQAPTELVWKMWTEPEHFAAWYGPGGATIPVAKMDVRVGGKRLLCMEIKTPDGVRQMWFTGEYLEVVQNQRLVYTDAMSDENGNVMSPEQLGLPDRHPTTTEVRVELEPTAGGTKLVLTHIGIPAGSPGAAGWAIALDNLVSYIDEERPDELP